MLVVGSQVHTQNALNSLWRRGVPKLPKRVRIELQDEEGTKYTLALEGKLSREKVMKVMDLIEMINLPIDDGNDPRPDESTFFGKLFSLIETAFPANEFSSSDVAREFEERYNQPVRLATVSTYLSRLTDRNHLRREKFGNSWVYRRVYLKTNQLVDR